MLDHSKNSGFSLVEAVVGLGVMALVITGGLVALGQASLLSEKSSEQVMADFVLRGEVEALRNTSWSDLSSHHSKITAYNSSNPKKYYPSFVTYNAKSLLGLGFEAEVISAQLNNIGETGKLALRILLRWQDRSGKLHEEARVLVITEGGFSADS